MSYIGATDIYQGNLKLILGLLWALILRYQIAAPAPTSSDTPTAESKEAKRKRVNAKKLLLDWINAVLPSDGINNFTTDWNDGLRLSSLVNYCQPGLIPNHASLNPENRLENVTHAMDVAENELGVPKILHPEDLAVDKPEELSVMTYISGFCRPGSAGQNSLLDWVNSKIPNTPVSNFTTDWADGTALASLIDSLTEGGFQECEQMKDNDRFQNCQEAMDAAERLLGVKKSLSPEDFSEKEMDQLTRSTYITQFRHATPSPATNIASTLKAVGPGVTGASAEKETNFVVRGPRIPHWAKLETIVISPEGAKLPVKMQTTSTKATQFQYTPEVPGNYVVDVAFNGEPIPGSPFNVTHVPPTNVDGCVATGSGLSKARVGETAGFSVNCEQGGPGTIEVDIEGPNGNVTAEIEETMPKNYDVNFTPSETGDHFVSVLWDNKNIPSSPFTCVVTDPKKCTVAGSGFTQAFVNQPQTFTVKGDKAGPGDISVLVEGPNGSITPKIKGKGDGTFDVTYLPEDIGPHKISVSWNDDPIPGSPFTVSVLAPADASKCTVTDLPEGRLRTNTTYSFNVDFSEAGTGEMKAFAQGPTVPESCLVKPNESGLYSVNFTPAEVGPLKVEVSYGGKPIPQSPFEFTVNDPTKVKVNRAAIESGTYLVKQPIQFVVSAAHAGEGEVAASVRNPNGEESVSVKDQGGKSYLVNYSPINGGSHAINITFDGVNILDVPIRIFVDDSSHADNIVVTQPIPGKFGYIVDTPYNYKVIAENAGQDELTVTSVGACTGLKPSVNVTDHGTDMYTVTFTAEKPDEYKVNIQWGGEEVPGSPFTLSVEDKPQADKITYSGPHYKVGSSEPVTLDVNAEDAGAGKLNATCSGKEVGTVQVEVAPTQPKKYLVSFTPPKDDIYSLSVMWLTENIRDSPFKINLIPPDASKCVVTGPEVPLDPHEPIVLYVNASNAGNGKIASSAVGDQTGEKDVDIKESRPNEFVLSFVPEITDFYTMNVMWAGDSVPGAPFRVNSSAANADRVMICEPPSAMLEAGQAIGICFDTSQGGKGVLTAVCKGKNIGEIPITVRQRSINKDKFDVRFLPPEPDIFFINVMWSGLDVKGSPFTINLMPVDVSKIRVIGPNMPHGSDGPVELMLQTAGAGKGKVTGTCSGKKTGQVEVVIKETSTDIFQLCFIPPEPDMYTFDVQYGSQKLHGSPFSINTLPANAGLVKVTEPDSIDVAKLLTFHVDATEAGSGKLNTLCRGDKYGQVQLDTISEKIGHYDLSFTPHHTDLYKISMDWDGENIPGSPFKVDLRLPIAESVKVGELHIPDEAGTGEYCWVDLDCSDAGHGPLKGEAKGKVVGKMPIEADRLSRTKYQMKFPPKEADIYTFAVAYGDNQVIGSPFKINLMPPLAENVKHTRTTLPEFEEGPVSMYFNTSEAGRGEMTASVSNKSTGIAITKVEKISFTEHKVTFIPDVPDIYDADIKWSGDPVSGSPFKVDTRPPLYPELIECDKPAYKDINIPVELALDTRKAGPGRVTAKCFHHDGSEIPVEVKKPVTPNYKYDISFVPKVHGNYDLSVFFEGDEIAGSPFPINLTPVSEVVDMVVVEDVVESAALSAALNAAPSDMEIEVEVEKDENPAELTVYLGNPLNMTISTEDEEQQNGKLVVTAVGTKTGPQKIDFTKNADGTYNIYFNPDVCDRYTIDIMLDSKPVPNSPIIANYLDAIDPAKCRIFGLQSIPPIPQVNEPIHFGVDTKDAGDSKLSITSDGPSLEEKASTLEMKESDKGEPGVYYVTYIPTALGEHRVHLFWGGDKIPATPLVFNVGDVTKIQRYPYGSPVTININADFSKTGDLDAYAIQEDTGTKLKVKVSKEKKGKYKLGFQPKQPGIYAVHLLHKKKETPGSPYRIRYLGPTNPNGVVITDFSGKGYVGCPVTFTINAEQAGTGDLGVRIEGPKGINDSDLTYSACPQSKEHCFKVSYTPRKPNDHFFHITWAGKPIPSSPFKASITESKPETKTVLHGEAINILMVGNPAPVRITSESPVLDLESITAQCQGAKTGNADVIIREEKEEKQRMFLVQFVPEIADDYTLNVKLNNNNIDGSPFNIKAIDKEVVSPDYAHPPGPQPSDVAAAQPVNIVCRAPGIKDLSDLKVSVEGPYGSCPPTVTFDSHEEVGVGFLPPLTGEYIIHAQENGSTIPSCPCKIRATGKDPDPSKVAILDKDKALFEGPIPFGVPARFRISTVDAGPGTLNITSKGPGKATVKVFDNKDGTYTCDFTPNLAGKYHIDIMWNDTHINGSPFLLHFKSKKKRVIAGLNLDKENFRVDIPHRFKLHCDDIGDGGLQISCKPASAADISLTQLPTGKKSYQCEILPKLVGNHEIQVQYDNKHIFGSPFNVQFEQRGDASKCHMIESSVTGQDTPQENVSFLISAKDAGKGRLTASVEQTSSKTQLPVSVTPLPDDLYQVEFKPEEEEKYLLTIKYDNEHIFGSPFKLMFGGDAADASQCTAEGDGIEACILDQEAKFTVNTLKPNNGELSVSIKGEKTLSPKMSPPGSTTTNVTYIADKIGKYDVSVKWANVEISNSPFHVECYNPLDPSLWMVEDPPSELFKGSSLNFSVKAVTAGTLSKGTLTVTAQSSHNKQITGTVEGSSDDGSSYNCTIQDIQDVGKYLIHVRWNGAHIKNSPFKVKVLTPPDATKVRAFGPGLENGFVGQEGNFTVETEDGGAGTLSVKVHGPKGAFKINMRRHPDNDRTILVRYDPTNPGKYTVDIMWSEIHIPGSPFKMEFTDQ